MTTHPFGDQSLLYDEKRTDWRTSYMLSQYASESMKVANALGIHALDIFHMSNVVHDLTYDSHHFKAPVENEIANAVLSTVESIFERYI